MNQFWNFHFKIISLDCAGCGNEHRKEQLELNSAAIVYFITTFGPLIPMTINLVASSDLPETTYVIDY